ncbi:MULTISPECIES: hypothetical protein [unclassified Nocardia]|uniref:hypothetical protein n=1 Tax=unclassified Nocardia TaxID=2637762 RepID=UPI001CE47AB4|nr:MULTISPECIES: hypothetical protein [unclassified Nocardia]
MTNPSAPPPDGGSPRRGGEWLLRLSLTLFALGLLAIIAIFLTSFFGGRDPGVWLYVAAMLTPVGFLLAIVFALWSGRRAR